MDGAEGKLNLSETSGPLVIIKQYLQRDEEKGFNAILSGKRQSMIRQIHK